MDMQSLDAICLKGRFVTLEALQAHHTDALLKAANVSRATFHFTLVPATLEAMTVYVERAFSLRAKREATPFVTIDATSKKIVGTTRFMMMEYWTWPADQTMAKTDGSPAYDAGIRATAFYSVIEKVWPAAKGTLLVQLS